jgi:uncharacterized membrane protein
VDTAAFLGALDDERIVAAIREAEARSRGEIRVHVTEQPVTDPVASAAHTFESIGMAGTAERNGVLIYVAPLSQRFAVIGDAGIHHLCPPTFWAELAEAMSAEFKAGRFTEGILRVVEKVGEALVRHFPRGEGHRDVNELPDAVSRD